MTGNDYFAGVRQALTRFSIEKLFLREGQQASIDCQAVLTEAVGSLASISSRDTDASARDVCTAYQKLIGIYQYYLGEDDDTGTQDQRVTDLGDAVLDVDSRRYPLDYLEIALGLAEAYQNISTGKPLLLESERDRELALKIVESCHFLCMKVDDKSYRHRVLFLLAQLKAARYSENRDSNLAEAIHCLTKLMEQLKSHCESTPEYTAILYNDLANTLVNYSVNRSNTLQRASSAYKTGLQTVDQTKTPGLYRVLKGNNAWIDAQIAAQNNDLTDKEVLSRYRYKIEMCQANDDIDEALNMAWGLLQTSWRHKDAPARLTVHAHDFIGKLLLAKGGDTQGVIAHLYCALILTEVIEDERMRQQLFDDLKQTLIQQFEQQKIEKQEINAYFEHSGEALRRAYQAITHCADVIETSPAEALDASYQAIRNYHFFPRAWFYQGVALQSIGQVEKAVDAFSQSLVIDPSSHYCLINRGVCLLQLQRYEEAEKDFAIVLKEDSQNRVAIINLVQIYLQKNEFQKALEFLDKHENLLGNQAIYYRFLGICHENLGNTNLARKDYESALGLAETDGEKEWTQNRLKALTGNC